MLPMMPVRLSLPVTCVYPTGRGARVLKSTIETLEPVSASVLRSARAAGGSSVGVEPIEPDSSRTRMTSIPHFGGRSGIRHRVPWR